MTKLSGAKIRGYDVSPTYLNVAQRLLHQHPELSDALAFRLADISKDPLPGSSADAAVVYGSFFYIVSRHAQRQAMGNLFRILRPGGPIFFYHPNRLFPIEPFTRMWFVHWLPRPTGTWLTARRGKRTMMDLCYHSPCGLRRLLEQAGFEKVRHGVCGRRSSRIFVGPLRYFSPYYTMSARRPLGERTSG